KFSSAGIEGGLAQAPGVTKSSDGLAGSLPGGDSVPPELLTTEVAAMDLGHVLGLLIGEEASSIPDPARRPWTGRLRRDPEGMPLLVAGFQAANSSTSRTPSGRPSALLPDLRYQPVKRGVVQPGQLTEGIRSLQNTLLDSVR